MVNLYLIIYTGKKNKKKVDYMWCFTDENKYKNAPKELKNMFKCTYIEKIKNKKW